MDHLGGLGIDADVHAPYVTGVMEDTTSTTEERASSVVRTDPRSAPSESSNVDNSWSFFRKRARLDRWTRARWKPSPSSGRTTSAL